MGLRESTGVTFEAIEAQGAEALLEQLRDELTGHTYKPLPARSFPQSAWRLPQRRGRRPGPPMRRPFPDISKSRSNPTGRVYRPMTSKACGAGSFAASADEWRCAVPDFARAVLRAVSPFA